MATFYNQATLSYGGNVVNSNTTEAELLSGLQLTKTPITANYTAGGNVVYATTLNNMGSVAYNGLTVTDNLGAYTLPGGGTAIPLTYVDGSILYYLNGVLQPAPTVETTGNLTIQNIDLPASSIATFIYEVKANSTAPIAAGSTITNTVTTNGGAGVGEITASAVVTVEEEPALTIAKTACPAVLTDNQELTYTMVIQNLGNAHIVATDNVVINDTFTPILSNLTVELNGVALEQGVGYTYDSLTGVFATVAGVVTVPAATYVQSPETGTVNTTPGVTVLTVSGTI